MYFNRTLLLFSRPMRDKDTSALREMFQYSSLAKKPFDQWEIATHWRAFQIQDKSRHGLVKMTYSGDNWWCPCNFQQPESHQRESTIQCESEWASLLRTTDTWVECSYQSSVLRSYHNYELLHKSWSKFSFSISTKLQFHNLNQISASKYWPNSSIKVSTELQFQNPD